MRQDTKPLWADAELVKAFFMYLERINGYRHCKVIPPYRYAAIVPFLYTTAIVTGDLGNFDLYDDRWCYHDIHSAKVAFAAWNGVGEPKGWIRHPASGRRVAQGRGERDKDGNEVAIGAAYVRL